MKQLEHVICEELDDLYQKFPATAFALRKAIEQKVYEHISRLRQLRDDTGIAGLGLERTHPAKKVPVCDCPVCSALGFGGNDE